MAPAHLVGHGTKGSEDMRQRGLRPETKGSEDMRQRDVGDQPLTISMFVSSLNTRSEGADVAGIAP